MAVHEVKPQVRHLLPQGNRAHGTDPTQHDQCNHTRNELAVVNKLHGRYSRPRPQRVKRTYCSSLSHPCLPEAISSCTGSLLNLTRNAPSEHTVAHFTIPGCQRRSTKQPRPLLPNGQRWLWPGVVPGLRDSTPCQPTRAKSTGRRTRIARLHARSSWRRATDRTALTSRHLVG